jgi:hypothetical protein
MTLAKSTNEVPVTSYEDSDVLGFLGSHTTPTIGLDPTKDRALTIHNVLILCSKIYRQALDQSPVAFTSPQNHGTLTLLHQALSRTSGDDTWLHFPGILTWVLLTGLAAATQRPERTLFVTYLGEVSLWAMQGWWEDFVEAFLNFREIQRTAEAPSKNYAYTTENVEI